MVESEAVPFGSGVELASEVLVEGGGSTAGAAGVDVDDEEASDGDGFRTGFSCGNRARRADGNGNLMIFDFDGFVDVLGTVALVALAVAVSEADMVSVDGGRRCEVMEGDSGESVQLASGRKAKLGKGGHLPRAARW